MERLLINYLPHVVREYDVFKSLTTGEQPEFELAWNGYELALANQFIDTADDYGLARWEKILKITVRATDTLESRRIAIKAALNSMIPYTLRALKQKLAAVAEGFPFVITLNDYLFEIVTQWERNGQISALKGILDQMLPANIAVKSLNHIPCKADGNVLVAGGICFMREVTITNDGVYNSLINGALMFRGGSAASAADTITNDGTYRNRINSELLARGGSVGSVSVMITNDFVSNHTIRGKQALNGGLAHTITKNISNDFQDNIHLEGKENVSVSMTITEIISPKGE